jgi:NAD(P)-dependent dehydrogenase (short-subunit alcohol dehydrogenase family)
VSEPGTDAGGFEGQVVVVTGAAGQIGGACVEAFAHAGAQVVAVDLTDPGARGDYVTNVQADLADETAIEGLFEDLVAKVGPPSAVIQSAAVYGRGISFLELTTEYLDRIFAINIRAVLLVGRAAARAMIAAQVEGAIVNLSSTSAVLADGVSVAYETSKGAVDMATRSMAVALAPHKIRVNAVAPGNMVKFQEADVVRAPEDLDEIERARIPLGRLGLPVDVAEAALYLASARASYVTGTVLYVDGGQVATYSTAGS